MSKFELTRRGFLVAAPLALSACMSGSSSRSLYAAIDDDVHPVPEIDTGRIDPRWLRQTVAFAGPETSGEVVCDPERRFLYLVGDGGTALRYGCGVGRQGFALTGKATVARKAEWPRWTPTPNMLRVDPERNRPWAGGMEGGPRNPLGARALYLYRGGRDTLFRIHGTNEAWSIGRQVSSGCIRLFNQDVIDVYERVPVGTTVTVLPRGSTDRTAATTA